MAKENDSGCKENKKQSFCNRCFRLIGISTGRKWYNIQLNGIFFAILGILFLSFIVFSASMFIYSTKPEFCTLCHIMEPYYQAWETSTHREVSTCVDCHYPKEVGFLPQRMRAMSQLVQYITRTYRPKPRAEVPDANCLQAGCHETRLLQGEIVNEKGILFDHTPHLTEVRRGKQLQCTSCHSQIVVFTHIEVTFPTCYLCHFRDHKPSREELPLAGCTSCHNFPSKPISLSDGAEFNHTDYVRRPEVKCRDCHLDSIAGDGLAPKERCFDCHNRPERIEQYESIDFVHKHHVADHKVECGACHLEIKHKVGAAEFETGTCAQCHNADHDAVMKMYYGRWPGTEKVQPSAMARARVQCIACHIKETQPGMFGSTRFAADPAACDRCHGEGFGDFVEQWETDISETLREIDARIKEIEAVLALMPEASPERHELKELLREAKRDAAFTRAGRGEHNYELASEKLIKLNKLLETSLPAQ